MAEVVGRQKMWAGPAGPGRLSTGQGNATGIWDAGRCEERKVHRGEKDVMNLAHTRLPQPRPRPVVGNLFDLDPKKGLLRWMELAQEHGPIFRLQLPGQDVVVVSSQELVDELCDETRFAKKVTDPLLNLRPIGGAGLFTADTADAQWGSAHRILMPSFGPAALPGMLDGMADIADQLLLKWERMGPTHRIDVVDDTTRLTLDTIALCAFGYRFNSLYSDEPHPMVGALNRVLQEAQRRGRRLDVQNRLMRGTRKRFEQDVSIINRLADDLIADRRRHPLPDGGHDILDTMLRAADPLSGERLSVENARQQLVTFLIAGHETTSGLLSFAINALLAHPDVLNRTRATVDRVLGGRRPRFADLDRLDYLGQVLKETLRLWPTAPGFALQSLADTTIGAGFPLGAGQAVLVLTPSLHRDPNTWDDPESFDPDRFSFERARALPPNAWKPFGNGRRACIGRGFALQEATLFLAMLLQRFDITRADPDYRLSIKQTLTIKPAGLHLLVRRRPAVPAVEAQDADRARATGSAEPTCSPAPAERTGIGVRVLYGSNSGNSEAFARRIATDGRRRGYDTTVDTLDSAAGQLATSGAVVIVCSSYEGQPPDNAAAFTRWLRQVPEGALAGLRFAVFGNGNKDWARTYQAVPTMIDDELVRTGATRVQRRGEANACADFLGEFDRWYSTLWSTIDSTFGQHTDTRPAPAMDIEFVGDAHEPILRRHDLQLGTVLVNRELCDTAAPGARSKRHLEIALPPGMTYRTGDYLAVLPQNPPSTVTRALGRFGLAADALLVIRHGHPADTFLPVDAPVGAGELLAGYLDLTQPATHRQIATLAQATQCPPERIELDRLAGHPQAHRAEIVEHRVSILDLLERHPACQLSFAGFVGMLGPLTPRQYSIASSPLDDPDRVALTVAVVAEPALSGQGTFLGAASNYLAATRTGSRVAVTVRPSNLAFHPPESLSTPIIMCCAGTGIAPFRGFLRDRAERARREGMTPAPALLFFGCRHPDIDHLYRDELAAMAADGLVEIHTAYSSGTDPEIHYVQDRLWATRSRVEELVGQGAIFYLCGDSRRMAPAVFDTCARIYRAATGATVEQAQEWLSHQQHQQARYVADVYS